MPQFTLQVNVTAENEQAAQQLLHATLERARQHDPTAQKASSDDFADGRMPARAFTMAMRRGQLGRQHRDPVKDGRASYRAAQMVLVEGRTIAEARKVHGISQQAVSRAIQRVRAALLKDGSCPCCGGTNCKDASP